MSWRLLLTLVVHIEATKHIASGILLDILLWRLLGWCLVHEAEGIVLIILLGVGLLIHETKCVLVLVVILLLHGVVLVIVVHCHAPK